MLKPFNHFNFEINIHGAKVTVRRDYLTVNCLTDSEVDWSINTLKADLDDVAANMKKAIAEQRENPPPLYESVTKRF